MERRYDRTRLSFGWRYIAGRSGSLVWWVLVKTRRCARCRWDGWMPYKALDCQHALCNQHHLRELTYLLEEQHQAWAGDMIALLTHANHQDNLNCADGKAPRYDSQKYQSEVRDLRALYDAILAQAQADNPIEPATGKPGRPKRQI